MLYQRVILAPLRYSLCASNIIRYASQDLVTNMGSYLTPSILNIPFPSLPFVTQCPELQLGASPSSLLVILTRSSITLVAVMETRALAIFRNLTERFTSTSFMLPVTLAWNHLEITAIHIVRLVCLTNMFSTFLKIESSFYSDTCAWPAP